MRRAGSRSWLAATGAIVVAAAVFAASAGGAEKGGAARAGADGPATAPSAAATPPSTHTAGYNTDRNAYFGDLHVHTRYSFDAYIFNVRATPDDAYRYARGESIRHASGYDVRLADAPLDFLAVTDHSEYLGVIPALNEPGSRFAASIPYARDLFSADVSVIQRAFQRVATSIGEGRMLPELFAPDVTRAAWSEIKASADRNYQPGRLTTFVGYEFTSAPGGKNLHRNVIFAGAAPNQPYTAFDAGQNPENLWRWMDAQRSRGAEVLAIPHNMNGSDGMMFERTMWDGKAMDQAYAELRTRNEPLAEMTQVKGTSDTHPLLSPNDEWADFEIMNTYIGADTPITKFEGGYVRDALQTGLAMQAEKGFNPYRFGLIGSSDTHNAAGTFDEKTFFGKVGVMDGVAARRGSIPAGGKKDWAGFQPGNGNIARYSSWGAAGLAGVWAEENTREAIFAALKRKETFATSGPRIRVRFFAGYDFAPGLLRSPSLVSTAYRSGVPMGGDLLARGGRAPKFVVWAMRDPHSNALQRVQVIKGWIEDGKKREAVYDVACSDGLSPGRTTHRCPDNGATVNITDCSVTANKGAAELRTLWSDPAFDARQHAFYYVRVLENPSCRWSTWDAVRNGTPPRPDLKTTIQERAWSSPIWFAPAA